MLWAIAAVIAAEYVILIFMAIKCKDKNETQHEKEEEDEEQVRFLNEWMSRKEKKR